MVVLSSSLFFLTSGAAIPSFDTITSLVSPRYLRRIDRFSQLAVSGAITCLQNKTIDPQTPLILVSDSGGTATMKLLKETVINENHLPPPYTFINTLTNSASFLIAKTFSLISENYALSAGPNSFNTVQKYISKCNLLSTNNRVILGFVQEGDQDAEGLSSFDWSAWFLLSSDDNFKFDFTQEEIKELSSEQFKGLQDILPLELFLAFKCNPAQAKIII
jgi:hypothetical protein